MSDITPEDPDIPVGGETIPAGSLTYTFNDTHSLTFLLVRTKEPGFTYTFSF